MALHQSRRRWSARVALAALLTSQSGVPLAAAAPSGTGITGNALTPAAQAVPTATPIKHVIVLIGENRSFDHTYATYVPQQGQSVANLLSKRIINADGSPGPHKDAAKQFQIATINPVSYFISTDTLIHPHKTAYAPFLPTPEVGSAPPRPVTLKQLQKDPVDSLPPFDASTFSLVQLERLSQGLEPGDLSLLTTGATGLKVCPVPPKTTVDPTDPPQPCQEPDTRVAHFNQLPNTVFELAGPTLPYDSYTGDMVHRFFHMWQQSDCAVAHATP